MQGGCGGALTSDDGGIVVDFVALLSFRSTVPVAERDEALVRRSTWKYPPGVQMIAEYWPSSASVQVVSIFSADSSESLLELELEWGDVFDIAIYPAVSAEDGLRMGPDVIGRLSRLQQP
ncbi:MAG: DUF3303 family protein [Nocardiopsaceae bacterium]|jgi:hypothetical protein|nr:DUF3303 family protein [Nocardiopsaceae bacterium]